jgi:hypothetical protein
MSICSENSPGLPAETKSKERAALVLMLQKGTKKRKKLTSHVSSGRKSWRVCIFNSGINDGGIITSAFIYAWSGNLEEKIS